MTAKRIARLESQGRGAGYGETYKPWLGATEVPTSGRMNRWFGIKTGRVQHFLSDTEAHFLPFAEFDQRVTDISEQVALLPLARTVTLAKALELRHPRRWAGNKIVMTTDLVLAMPTRERPDRRIAIAVKPSPALVGRRGIRTREKLLIEQAYWAAKGVELKVVTEQDVPLQVLANLIWLREAWLPHANTPASPPDVTAGMLTFARTFSRTAATRSLASVLGAVARRLALSDERADYTFRRCVWMGLIAIDLRVPIRLSEPPIFTSQPNCGVTFPW